MSWIQEEHVDPILIRGGVKRLTIREKQEYFVQGLVGVGLKTAKLLLDNLGTPNNIVNAITDSTILYTRTGKTKGISGELAA